MADEAGAAGESLVGEGGEVYTAGAEAMGDAADMAGDQAAYGADAAGGYAAEGGAAAAEGGAVAGGYAANGAAAAAVGGEAAGEYGAAAGQDGIALGEVGISVGAAAGAGAVAGGNRVLGEAAMSADDFIRAASAHFDANPINVPDVDEVVTTPGPVIDKMVSMTAGAELNTFDFAAFDIFRDFFQIMSLFFSSFPFGEGFRSIFGNLFSLLALNITGIVLNIQIVVENPLPYLQASDTFIFIILCLLSVSCHIVLYTQISDLTPDSINDGLEMVTWDELSKSKKLRLRILLTILTTIFLPLSTQCIQIFVCDPNLGMEGTLYQCWNITHFGFMAIAAVMTASLTLYVPYLVYTLVEANKPKEIKFDALGRETEFTLVDYKGELAKDKCPYKFLYDGYERDWAFYKVIIMAVKLLLALNLIVTPTVLGGSPLSDPEEAETVASERRSEYVGSLIACIITCVILATYSAISFKLSPFIKKGNDVLDMAARVTSLLTALIGLSIVIAIGYNADLRDTLKALDVILIVLHFLNIGFMLSIQAFTSNAVRNWWRKFRKTLKFTKDHETRKYTVFSADLDFQAERKLRLWHHFWDALFLYDPEFQPPQIKEMLENDEEGCCGCCDGDNEAIFTYAVLEKTAPYLQKFQGSVGERHLENKEILKKVGKEDYRAALERPTEDVLWARKVIVEQLVGLDVFYDGIPEDGHLDSKTMFGKLYVIPFPFCAVLTYDDDEDYVYLRTDHEIMDVAMKNVNNEEIIRRRFVRHQLRALDGETLEYHHVETIPKTKTKSVSDGKGGTKTESYTVQVDFTFSSGRFTLTHNKEDKMWQASDGAMINTSAGFTPVLLLVGGEGVDREGKRWTNEQFAMNATRLGITENFAESEGLVKLLNGCPHWEKNMKRMQKRYAEYRKYYADEVEMKKNALSYGFWANIYDFDMIPREDLCMYLEWEDNPSIRDLPTTHDEYIDFLYARAQYYDSHPGSAYWFIFFDDVWENNSDLEGIMEAADLLDPSKQTSIAYSPMPRENLERALDARDLLGYFKPKILDAFYNNLDDVCNNRSPSHKLNKKSCFCF